MSAPRFLSTYIPTDHPEPWITLTYAQSLDARIAGRDKRQIRLSGEESMAMTHWYVLTRLHYTGGHEVVLIWMFLCTDRMRSLHDAIMVGAGTAINDDPRLNGRLKMTDLPALLKDLGIRSLMVEGGAEIIRQLLQSELRHDSGRGPRRPLADLLIVTVAPVLVPDGYSVLPSSSEADSPATATKSASYEHCHTEIMGRDAVMVLRAVSSGDIE
ncbi:hypothetical protein QFC21_004140 [Naganishia friedmannii]|uniref:Uncharacterized protein n=1 Tax=Naganishia friedmannii TaxID=89922 RepID=A0ACC2VJC6_9TREE|nr:hypothetical protein QFC21_004140 [Naganishia friedmannii]